MCRGLRASSTRRNKGQRGNSIWKYNSNQWVGCGPTVGSWSVDGQFTVTKDDKMWDDEIRKPGQQLVITKELQDQRVSEKWVHSNMRICVWSQGQSYVIYFIYFFTVQ